MLAALVLLLAVLHADAAPPPIPGDDPLEKVLADAKERDRPVLVDFVVAKSEACARMDAEVFADAGIVALCKDHFVLYRVDAEKGAGVDVNRRFAVDDYPTVVLLGPDGVEVDRRVGFCAKEEFLPLLQETLAGRHFAGLPALIEKSPGDAVLRVALARKLLARGKAALAKEQFEKAAALDPKDEKPITLDARLQLAFLAAAEAHLPDPVVAFAAKYPASPNAVEAHRALLQHAIDRHDLDGTIASFEFLHGRGALDHVETCRYAFLLATERNEGEKALAIAEAALKTDSESLFGPLAKAFALSALGRHDEAVEWGNKALASSPPELKGECGAHVEELVRLRDEAKAKAAAGKDAPKEPEKKE